MTPDAALADALDELAARVFGGPDGERRLEPLARRFEEAVGTLPRDHDDWSRWQEIRADWALCDAPLDGVGDTWARRAAAGLIPGLAPLMRR